MRGRRRRRLAEIRMFKKRVRRQERRNRRKEGRRTRNAKRMLARKARNGARPAAGCPANGMRTFTSVQRKGFRPELAVVLTLPEIFDFDANYKESALFIEYFRDALVKKQRIKNIDFSKMRRASPACVIVLASYIDLWKRGSPSVHARVDTWHPGICSLFRQMGFFEMLNLRAPDITETGDETPAGTQYMALKSFAMCDGITEFAAGIPGIRNEIETFVGAKISSPHFYAGVAEAVTNIYNHAYAYMPDDGKRTNRWWMSVAHDSVGGRVTIMIFDHGEGIPATLHKSKKFSWRIQILRPLHRGDIPHGVLLQYAFEHGPEFANVMGRGNGLWDILQFAKQRKESELMVRSCRGVYHASNRGAEHEWESAGVPVSLQGTLVEWRIAI